MHNFALDALNLDTFLVSALHQQNVVSPSVVKRVYGNTHSEEHAKSSHERNLKVLLQVLPVTLYGPAANTQAYAMLDMGSTCSLIRTDIARKLRLRGPPEEMTLNGIQQRSVFSSKRVTFEISSPSNPTERHLVEGAWTVKELNLPRMKVDMRMKVDKRKNGPILPTSICQRSMEVKLWLFLAPAFSTLSSRWRSVLVRRVLLAPSVQLLVGPQHPTYLVQRMSRNTSSMFTFPPQTKIYASKSKSGGKPSRLGASTMVIPLVLPRTKRP